MPRSSGQYPIPSRTIWWGGIPTVSRPLTITEPVRRPVRPRMAFRVVVRPEPLRPRRVTSSPLFTVKSIPWRTCDSP